MFMSQGKHAGKIVLDWQQSQDNKQLQKISINADAAYLVTGGFGGLGLEVAKWLIAQGATNLILLS